MPIQLIVMRHAKSSWKSPAADDHDRPLNGRGRRDAPLVAARLLELGWAPTHILSSDARRTVETTEGMQPTWTTPPTVHYLREFYHAGPEEVIPELQRLPGAAPRVMVVGHNPGWEELVEWLSGDSVVMKTASAALLSAPIDDWSQLSRGSFNLYEILRSRELAGEE